MIEQGLELARVVAIIDLKEQIPSLDFVQRASCPVVLLVLDDQRDILFRAYALEQQRHWPNEHLLAWRDGYTLARGDALTSYVRAVGAARILNEQFAVDVMDKGVFTRNLCVIDDDVVALGATDRLRFLRAGGPRHLTKYCMVPRSLGLG